MPSTFSSPANSGDLGTATWQVMHLEGSLYAMQEAMVQDNGPEVRRLMVEVNGALMGFKKNPEALRLLDEGPFNAASRERLFRVLGEKYPVTRQQATQNLQSRTSKLTKYRPYSTSKLNQKTRKDLLRLRGGGEHGGTEEEEVTDQRSPILKPTLAYKVFNCLDDPVISIGLVLLNLATTIIGFVKKSYVIAFLGTFTLWVMVVTQLIEVWLHTSIAKKKLEEKNRIRIVEAIDPIEAWQVDKDLNFLNEKREQRTKLIQGSEGNVVILCIRELIPEKVDDGAFIQIEGTPDKLYYLPWHKYKNVIIISGLGDYFSYPMNVFNNLLLLFCVVSQYAFPSDSKKAAYLKVALVALRVIRPILRLIVQHSKVSKYGGGNTPRGGELDVDEVPDFAWKCC